MMSYEPSLGAYLDILNDLALNVKTLKRQSFATVEHSENGLREHSCFRP